MHEHSCVRIGYSRIKYKIINEPEIGIIIVTHDKSKMLKTLLNSIEQKTSYKNYKIFVLTKFKRNSLKFRNHFFFCYLNKNLTFFFYMFLSFHCSGHIVYYNIVQLFFLANYHNICQIKLIFLAK